MLVCGVPIDEIKLGVEVAVAEIVVEEVGIINEDVYIADAGVEASFTYIIR